MFKYVRKNKIKEPMLAMIFLPTSSGCSTANGSHRLEYLLSASCNTGPS